MRFRAPPHAEGGERGAEGDFSIRYPLSAFRLGAWMETPCLSGLHTLSCEGALSTATYEDGFRNGHGALRFDEPEELIEQVAAVVRAG